MCRNIHNLSVARRRRKMEGWIEVDGNHAFMLRLKLIK